MSIGGQAMSRPVMALSRRALVVVALLGVMAAARYTSSSATVAQNPEPGTIVLADDFEDPTVGVLHKTSPQLGRYLLGYLGGEYYIRKLVSDPFGSVRIALPGSYGDAAVALDVRLVGDTRGRFILVDCRFTDADSGATGYRLTIHPESRVLALFRAVGGRFNPIASTQVDFAFDSPAAQHRVELSCVGTTISASIDGIVVLWERDDTYNSGTIDVGVQADVDRVEAEVRFDDLKVIFAPEPPAAPPPPITSAPPAGATQMPTAPNTVTAAPAMPAMTAPGTVVLSDNFDDPARNLVRLTTMNPMVRGGYDGGEFIIETLAGLTEAFAGLAGRYRDVSVAVDARLVGDAAARAIIVECRTNPMGHYRLQVQPDIGILTVFRVENRRGIRLAQRASSAILRGTATNRLELTCIGDLIMASINAVQVASVRDSVFTEGSIFIGVISADQMAATVRFDNLVVTQQ